MDYDIFANWQNYVHPECGKTWTVDNEIIKFPFFTEQGCEKIIELAKTYDRYFHRHQQGHETINYKGNLQFVNLDINFISRLGFLQFIEHYKLLFPMISEVWPYTKIPGWFSPLIVKYETAFDDKLDPHHDLSLITMVVKLNNNFDGGDLIFPRQNYNNTDLPVGHAVMFPGTLTHCHYTKPMISGTKYSLTSWTWPPEWPEGKFHGVPNSQV
jgi:hypothetical protein